MLCVNVNNQRQPHKSIFADSSLFSQSLVHSPLCLLASHYVTSRRQFPMPLLTCIDVIVHFSELLLSFFKLPFLCTWKHGTCCVVLVYKTKRDGCIYIACCLFRFSQAAQVSERENHPADANGSSGNNGASEVGGPSSSMKKRKHHDDMEPFKDAKRVIRLVSSRPVPRPPFLCPTGLNCLQCAQEQIKSEPRKCNCITCFVSFRIRNLI